jgi:hypothetical protein
MSIIAIIIIIVVLIIIVACSYPYIKYYYLRKSKPKEFVIYANDRWLVPEMDSLKVNIIDLDSEINLLDNQTNQMFQTAQMGLNLVRNLNNHDKIHSTPENSLYDRIESKCNNCIYNLDKIRKYVMDINRIDRYSDNPIQLINTLNNDMYNIRNKFTNSTFGVFKAFEDATKMNKEKELKRECINLMTNIQNEYAKLLDIINRKDLTPMPEPQPPIEQPPTPQPEQISTPQQHAPVQEQPPIEQPQPEQPPTQGPAQQ